MAHRLVRETWKGIRRARGVAQQEKAALLTADLRRMMGALAPGMRGARDRALLLLGFAGAFRRSELVALDVEDLDFREEGLIIFLRRSKRLRGAGGPDDCIFRGSVPATCPCRSLRAWLEGAGITHGPVFRPVNRHGGVSEQRLSDRAVALVIKRYAVGIGRDPSEFSGHSLRAGLVTSAALAGASEASIMAQTGHRSAAMVRRYLRVRSVFQDNAAGEAGLERS